MTGSIARAHHDATKQTWRRMREPAGETATAVQPLPYKLYPDVATIPLPLDLRESDWPALDGLSGASPPNVARPDLSWLSSLLFYSAGVTRRWVSGRHPLHFRAAPSAGARYPIEVYVVCDDLPGVPGLRAGVYHFEPYEFGLHPLREGDHRRELARAAASDRLGRVPISLVLTAMPWRSAWRYGDRAYRHLFWDAGTIISHVLGLSTAAALDAQVVAGFVDRDVAGLVGVDPGTEIPVAVVGLGPEGAAAPVPAERPAPLDLLHIPLSDDVGDGPEIGREHRAGDLDNASAVEVWRGAMRHLRAGRATAFSDPPALATFDLLEDVVLRRGSTRRFAPDAEVTAESLGWPLAVAARPVPADWTDENHLLVRNHVVVHAVQGVAPGAYVWGPAGPEPVRPGRFRGECATLCQEQDLGGDGAYTVFHLGDLEAALAAGGARAYRAAQLEAGISAGRLQLAAFTLGLGATGLTFYDDDVSRFLETDLEPLTATAVGRPGYVSRPGRRPSEAPPARLADGWGR